jgi:hypothetical protein
MHSLRLSKAKRNKGRPPCSAIRLKNIATS